MKHPVLSLALILTTLAVPANAQAPVAQPKVTFQNLTFGEPPQIVKTKLSKFKLEHDKGDIVSFKGEVGGEPALVYTSYTPKTKKLRNVGVYFTSGNKDSIYLVKNRYERFVEILTKKYGAPTDTFAFYSSPYEEGDGYELQAIRMGKGNFMSYWKLEDGIIACEIDKDLDIKVVYENRKYTDIGKQEAEAAMSGDL